MTEETWFQREMREELEALVKEITTDKKMHKQLEALFKNPDYIHLVGLYKPPRPGVHLFSVKLEYGYFTPGTPANDDFIFAMLQQGQVVWSITSVPKTAMDIVKKVAEECDLKLVNGIPFAIGPGGKKDFPISNKNIYVLENIPGSNVYKAKTMEEMSEILAKETMEMEKIFHEVENKLSKK